MKLDQVVHNRPENWTAHYGGKAVPAGLTKGAADG
jgi:hypothetical protein